MVSEKQPHVYSFPPDIVLNARLAAFEERLSSQIETLRSQMGYPFTSALLRRDIEELAKGHDELQQRFDTLLDYFAVSIEKPDVPMFKVVSRKEKS